MTTANLPVPVSATRFAALIHACHARETELAGLDYERARQLAAARDALPDALVLATVLGGLATLLVGLAQIALTGGV